MPGTGSPSLPKIFSSGSRSPLHVTRPFSVIPQPAETTQPSRARASRTSARGMGAPAAMNSRSERRSRRASA